jgi:hypothetical protein
MRIFEGGLLRYTMPNGLLKLDVQSGFHCLFILNLAIRIEESTKNLLVLKVKGKQIIHGESFKVIMENHYQPQMRDSCHTQAHAHTYTHSTHTLTHKHTQHTYMHTCTHTNAQHRNTRKAGRGAVRTVI